MEKLMRDPNAPLIRFGSLDRLPEFIKYLHTRSDDEVRKDLQVILTDRELENLGIVADNVRDLKPEQLEYFGTTNDRITRKLVLIIERVGDLMRRRS